MRDQDDARPTIEEVARAVAGKPPEAWLIEGLKRIQQSFRPQLIHLTDALPLAERQASLRKISAAAGLLRRGLLDAMTLSYLEKVDPGLAGLPPGFYDALHKLEIGARQSAKLLPGRPGEGKATRLRDGRNPPGPNEQGFDARGQCALIVRQAWILARQTERGSRAGNQVWDAAEAFWLACGGPPPSASGKEGRDWRRPFNAAATAPDDICKMVRSWFDLDPRPRALP